MTNIYNYKKFEKKQNLSDELKYALNDGLFNSFRYGSDTFFDVINEAKKNIDVIDLCDCDKEFLKTDIGSKGLYMGEEVWLDCPMVEINEKNEYRGKSVKLNDPKRGGNKKFYVYVKNDKGNIIKVQFGAKGGGQKLSVKLNDPEARKRYDQRHGCSKGKHNDKTKPGYWSCRLPRYASKLGLSYNGSAQWW